MAKNFESQRAKARAKELPSNKTPSKGKAQKKWYPKGK